MNVRGEYRGAKPRIFDSKHGFDVVLGNPPFVDAHTQAKNSEDYRSLLASLYTTARGPWDLYIVFWEKSLQISNPQAAVCLITPNKWLSVAYGKGLRSILKPSLRTVVDYSSFRAFEDIGVFPIVAFSTKPPVDSFEMQRIEEGHVATFSTRILKADLDKFGDWGFMLSRNPILILRLATTMRKLSTCCAVEEAFAVGEAYDLRSSLRELSSTNAESFRFINTGTIDPYVSLWGNFS